MSAGFGVNVRNGSSRRIAEASTAGPASDAEGQSTPQGVRPAIGPSQPNPPEPASKWRDYPPTSTPERRGLGVGTLVARERSRPRSRPRARRAARPPPVADRRHGGAPHRPRHLRGRQRRRPGRIPAHPARRRRRLRAHRRGGTRPDRRPVARQAGRSHRRTGRPPPHARRELLPPRLRPHRAALRPSRRTRPLRAAHRRAQLGRPGRPPRRARLAGGPAGACAVRDRRQGGAQRRDRAACGTAGRRRTDTRRAPRVCARRARPSPRGTRRRRARRRARPRRWSAPSSSSASSSTA